MTRFLKGLLRSLAGYSLLWISIVFLMSISSSDNLQKKIVNIFPNISFEESKEIQINTITDDLLKMVDGTLIKEINDRTNINQNEMANTTADSDIKNSTENYIYIYHDGKYVAVPATYTE